MTINLDWIKDGENLNLVVFNNFFYKYLVQLLINFNRIEKIYSNLSNIFLGVVLQISYQLFWYC